MSSNELNIFHKPLVACNKNVVTGHTGNGFCNYYFNEIGTNIICCVLSAEFLNFMKKIGYNILNATEGEVCCICIYKWIEAYHAGVAPKIIPESTSIKVLEFVPIEILKNYYA